MSQHRATAPLLENPQTEACAVPAPIDRSGGVLADLLGHTELERMRGMVLAFPRLAEKLLTERRMPDPAVRYTLRAETALRLGRPREAITLASLAVDYAAQDEPVDPGELLPAATVLADAAVMAGAPDAIRSCLGLVDLAGQFRDQHRVTVAAGLHTVAVFQQQSCRQATLLLDHLHRSCIDSGTAAAIALARDTVAACCARRGQPHWPPDTLPAITAGGLVNSALTPLFLPDRFQRWSGVHDCSSPAG